MNPQDVAAKPAKPHEDPTCWRCDRRPPTWAFYCPWCGTATGKTWGHSINPTDAAVVDRAWRAYAETHFRLKDSVPTDLERAGMSAAIKAALWDVKPEP